MPDWSYRTVFRPLLSLLPWPTVRAIAFGFLGGLNRKPGGGAVIDFLGHLRPDARLRRRFVESVTLQSSLGLSPALDLDAIATGALARFGFGFIELGPLTLSGPRNGSSTWSIRDEEIVVAQAAVGQTIDVIERAAAEVRSLNLALFVRWPRPTDVVDADVPQWIAAIERSARLATSVSIPAEWFTTADSAKRELGLRWLRQARESGVMAVMAVVTGRESDSDSQCLRDRIHDGTLTGMIIDAAADEAGGWRLSRTAFEPALAATKRWRAWLGGQAPIISGAGVHEPWQALQLLEAGATAVQLDSGLAVSGPGLPKRINESLLARDLAASDQTNAALRPGCLPAAEAGSVVGRSAALSWLWTLLLGLGLFVGGLLVLALGMTRVVLPYDEAMTGISRQQLMQINPRLLPFMVHDRVTLAATMLSVGALYSALSWFGVRRGCEWARTVVVWSALAGFFSFFTFLGFGYFDPLHAFVSGVLLQLTLLAMHSPLPLRRVAATDLVNDRAWVSSQWGQLLFVIHGAALITAGLTICTIGSTTVFVSEDLAFMNTTAEELCAANPSLIPLIAHDRASFGGMLLTCGITVLLSNLWGFQRGQCWLWWTLLLAGSTAYLGTCVVHWQVGYDALFHLIPAYGGLLSLWLGCALSRRYLLASTDPASFER